MVTIPGVLASCTCVRPTPRPTAQSVHLPSSCQTSLTSLSPSALLATFFELFVLFSFSLVSSYFFLLFHVFFLSSPHLSFLRFLFVLLSFSFFSFSLPISPLFFFFSFSLPISPLFFFFSLFRSLYLLSFFPLFLSPIFLYLGVSCSSQLLLVEESTACHYVAIVGSKQLCQNKDFRYMQ